MRKHLPSPSQQKVDIWLWKNRNRSFFLFYIHSPDVVSRRRQSSHRHRRWRVHAHIHHVCRLLVPSLHAYELFMAMMHTAPAETADAAMQVASMAHTSLVNNPTYNLLLNGIGVGTVASTILIKFWIYAVRSPFFLSPLVVESTREEVRQQRSLRERLASPSRRAVVHRGARRTLRPRIQSTNQSRRSMWACRGWIRSAAPWWGTPFSKRATISAATRCAKRWM